MGAGGWLLALRLLLLLQGTVTVPPPTPLARPITCWRTLLFRLRGGTEPPLVKELFELGFDKNLYTRATFYDEKGMRIPPPEAAFSPGPEKSNWAAEEMELMASRVQPHEWPDGHPGYDGHPFAGVKRPGWFLEEYIEKESADPHVQELNRHLWQSCAEGDTEQADKLLQEGAQVNAGDPREGDMWTALFYCCAPPPAAGLPDADCDDTAQVTEEKRLALLDCLLAHGALLQARDIWGETYLEPLHYAAVRGYPKLCKRLMQVGVDPNVENMYGCTALRNALINGKHMPSCREAARVMEDAGAFEILNPDQNPDEATDDSIPRFPRIPRGEFERLGGIPPLDQLQLDHTKPAYGTMKKDVVKYFRDEEEKIEKLRKKMEHQLIENADVS